MSANKTAMISSCIRTIQVVNVRWFNATAWYGMELARLLNAAGHPTLTIGLANTLSFAKAIDMGLAPIGLPLNTNNPLRMPALIADMRRLIADFRPNVVNCHRGEGFWLWGILKSFGNYALVRTRGDQRLPRNNLPNRILYRHTADAVISTNSRMAKHIVETLGVASPRVRTILGGVDTAAFAFTPQGREHVRSRLGYKPEHRVVGLLGRFDRVKGQKELLEAASHLIRNGLKNLRVMLLGFPTATSQEEMEAWIRNLGMEAYTAITGRVTNVAEYLSALDAGVIASLWSETIARAALELMACARPLISTSVGVMPDLLPPEALCPPGNTVSLANLLHRLLTNETLRNKLVAFERQRMADLTSQKFLQKTLAVYEEILRRNA